jgi:hypothetical protein
MFVNKLVIPNKPIIASVENISEPMNFAFDLDNFFRDMSSSDIIQLALVSRHYDELVSKNAEIKRKYPYLLNQETRNKLKIMFASMFMMVPNTVIDPSKKDYPGANQSKETEVFGNAYGNRDITDYKMWDGDEWKPVPAKTPVEIYLKNASEEHELRVQYLNTVGHQQYGDCKDFAIRIVNMDNMYSRVALDLQHTYLRVIAASLQIDPQDIDEGAKDIRIFPENTDPDTFINTVREKYKLQKDASSFLEINKSMLANPISRKYFYKWFDPNFKRALSGKNHDDFETIIQRAQLARAIKDCLEEHGAIVNFKFKLKVK